MIAVQCTKTTTAAFLRSSPALQTWVRHASNSKKPDSVTVPYESLTTSMQVGLRSIGVWDRAFQGSALAGVGGYVWCSIYSVESFLPAILTTLGLMSFPITGDTAAERAKDVAKDAMRSLSSLSIDKAIQEKVHELMTDSPYLSISACSSKIKITALRNGDEISSSQIIIPSHMLKETAEPLSDLLIGVKTPEKAINKLVLSKYLQGKQNPLKTWAKTSRISVSSDKNGNLFLENTYASISGAIKVGKWKGYPDFPESN